MARITPTTPVHPFNIVAWLLTITVCAVAFLAWAQGVHWRFNGLSTYELFGLFGLLAFSTMWSQYISLGVHNLAKAPLPPYYFKVTVALVLTFLLLHPGLLVLQLWLDGFGLPPMSYLEHYVSPQLHWTVILSSTSFFVFLAYDFRRFLPSPKWQRYVALASEPAMFAIFYHALHLGSETQQGWFRGVWIFYGISLAIALAYMHLANYRKKQTTRADSR